MDENIKFRIKEHLPFIGALFALGFWFLDILIDSLLFNDGTFLQQLLKPDPMELYFRLLVGGLFILFGVYAGRLLRKQRQLKEENQLKAEMLDQISDSVMIHDSEGKFIFLNEAACKLRGYSRKEMMRLNLPLINAPETRPLFPKNVEEIMRLGEKQFEAVNIRKDGTLVTLDVHSRAIKVAGRDAILSIARDISQRSENDHAREKLLKELQSALGRIKTMKGLIPICSHCKKIRNDKGYWQQVEEYLGQNTEADFSYGLCDQCAAEIYPEFSGPGKKEG